MRNENTALTPEDETTIDSASADELKKMHAQAGLEIAATQSAMKADANVKAAKQKLDEATADYKADLKRARQKWKLTYARLEGLGQA